MTDLEPRDAIEDLTREALGDLPQWDPDDVRASLRALFETYVTEHITDSIDWYFHRRGRKRRLGFSVRLGAVIAAAAGVTIPVLATLWTNDVGAPIVSAGWTAVALLLGAGLIWVDGFLDGTSGWLRYATTGLALTELRDDAVLRWIERERTWSGAPNDDDVTDALALIRELNAEANTIVRDETAAWRAQFQGSLRQLDGVLRSRLAASEQTLHAMREQRGRAHAARGALQVTVTAPLGVVGTRVRVEAASDDAPRDERPGPHAVFLDLRPGQYRVIAFADVGPNAVPIPPVEAVAVVTAGAAERVEVALG